MIKQFNPLVMLQPRVGNIKGIITIEGNIGAGKSTSIELIDMDTYNGIDIIFISEPDYTSCIKLPEEYRDLTNEKLPDTSILQYFYNDMRKYSFQFQVHAYCKRCDAIWRRIEELVNTDKEYIIITERSVISDKEIFTKNMIAEGIFPVEMIETYDMFWTQIAGKIAGLIKGMVYLRASINTIMERIDKRQRIEESAIEKEYIEQLNQRHEKMIEKYKDKMRVVDIDWNMNRTEQEIKEEMTTVIREMIDYICQ